MKNIKHYKNKFWSNWYTVVFQTIQVLYYRVMWILFNCKIEVIGIYDFRFYHKVDSENDWRKIIGTKSWTTTNKNYEEIVVNRLISIKDKIFVEQSKYIRTLDKWEVVDLVSDEIIPLVKRAKLSTIIEPKYLLPVYAYAGGDEINISDYSYKVKTKLYWKDFKLFKNINI